MCKESSKQTEDTCACCDCRACCNFSTHPKGENGEEEPTLVYLDHFFVQNITDFDCLKCTANVKVLMWVHWYDPRLKGYDKRALPKKLWTPRIRLSEELRDFETNLRECHLTDKDSGRLYALTEYTGTVYNVMRGIKDFPFDIDTLKLTFYACEYMLRDETDGNVAFKEDYRFLVDSQWRLHVYQHENVNLDPRKTAQYHQSRPFVLPEWEVVGITGNYLRKDHCQDVFAVTVHLSRKHMSILMNVLFPLWLTVFFTSGAYFMNSIEDTVKHATTLLLSTFVFLLVAGKDLPKAIFASRMGLTKMGQVTLLPMILFLIFGILSAFIYTEFTEEYFTEESDWDRHLRLIPAFAPPALFTICILVILVPTFSARMMDQNKKMSEHCGSKTKEDGYYRELTIDQPFLEEFQENVYQLETFKAKWKRNVDRAQTQLENNAPDYENMIEKAQNCGIVRFEQKEYTRTLSWKEWKERAEKRGFTLAAREDLKNSGIDHGDMDFWNPVSRKDGFEGDFIQMGKTIFLPEENGGKYCSHRDFFGKFGWDESGMIPHTAVPLEFIYVKGPSTGKIKHDQFHDDETGAAKVCSA